MKSVGKLLQSIDFFIHVSNFSSNILRPFLNHERPSVVLGNPISVPRVSRLMSPKEPHFCFVGRFTKEKGVETLAEAAKQGGFRVSFVGDGELARTIRNILPTATLTGWRSSAEVHDIVRKSTALVFPSLWYECQPLVPIEACALGTPCIVSDRSAAIDSVIDGKTGLYFRTGSSSSLAEKLAEISQTGVADALGNAAFSEYWASPSDPKNHVKRLEKIYYNLI